MLMSVKPVLVLFDCEDENLCTHLFIYLFLNTEQVKLKIRWKFQETSPERESKQALNVASDGVEMAFEEGCFMAKSRATEEKRRRIESRQ